MKRQIAVLGSTGSIGQSTLAVVRANRDRFQVISLAARAQWQTVLEQVEEFKPRIVAMTDPAAAAQLRQALAGRSSCTVLDGPKALVEVATAEGVDVVIAAIIGAAGLLPVIEAIKARRQVALANKEVMVAAGALVTRLAAEYGVQIVPVDSEHSAIFQCLKGEPMSAVRRLLLTASGGPFRGWNAHQLADVTPELALKHPNWTMGSKITIDSSTLMNKGLEIIEARWLFGVPYEQIQVVVHPQSVVHSMVEFVDGSVKAQLSVPDMKLSILYAMTHPDRLPQNIVPELDLIRIGSLTFEKPDTDTFQCLAIAIQAGREGRTYPTVLNAANEVAVARFLSGGLPYGDIPRLLTGVLERHAPLEPDRLDVILDADDWARRAAASWARP